MTGYLTNACAAACNSTALLYQQQDHTAAGNWRHAAFSGQPESEIRMLADVASRCRQHAWKGKALGNIGPRRTHSCGPQSEFSSCQTHDYALRAPADHAAQISTPRTADSLARTASGKCICSLSAGCSTIRRVLQKTVRIGTTVESGLGERQKARWCCFGLFHG